MSDAWSLNKVILIGRVGRDAEVRLSKGKNPTKYAYFTMATYQKFSKDRKKTTWHNVTSWSPKVAEFCGNFVKKGMLVIVEGKLDTREYTTSEGEKKKVTDVRADQVVFCEKKPEPEAAAAAEPEERSTRSKDEEPEYF